MDDLTPRQREMLVFIQDFLNKEGLPPTIAEIVTSFGLASPNGVAKHLQALEEKGYLAVTPNKARGIRLKGTAGGRRGRRGELELPILGRVAAGAPIGTAHAYDLLVVDRALFHTRPDYLLRVTGDSMRDDGILDGDLVAVRQAHSAENGQTVVARIDGEITIKRLKVTTRGIRLLPRNPAYAPIDVRRDADFAIEGVYCGLVRRD